LINSVGVIRLAGKAARELVTDDDVQYLERDWMGFFLGCLAIIPNLALMASEIATN